MNKRSAIYVAGHTGLIGSALCNELAHCGYENIITATHARLDLKNFSKVIEFFEREEPEYVFLCAAKVGGIHANNSQPADFIIDNLLIQTNVIRACYASNVKKFLFLGSSCIYPKEAPNPLQEDSILQGVLEPTNEAYAIAKLAGLVACKSYNRQYGTNYAVALPTNMYGPNDLFNAQFSHVIPALITKFHKAKIQAASSVELWGSGTPRREFIYSCDAAQLLVLMMEEFNAGKTTDTLCMNIGTGMDISIKDLAEIIKKVVDFRGSITWNACMPDGTKQKLLDVNKITKLRENAQVHKKFQYTPLIIGITQTYDWFLSNVDHLREIY